MIIKFRAYDKVLDTIINEIEMSSKTKEFGVRTTMTGLLNNPDYIVDVAFLKNKHGQWVFTNDVIKGKGFRGLKKVCFCELGYYLYDFNPLFFNIDIIKKCEIIGNVHKNPELIEKFDYTIAS
jgi:hypothetical protein